MSKEMTCCKVDELKQVQDTMDWLAVSVRSVIGTRWGAPAKQGYKKAQAFLCRATGQPMWSRLDK